MWKTVRNWATLDNPETLGYPWTGSRLSLPSMWGGERGTSFTEIAKGGWAWPSPLSGLRPCPSYAPGGRPGSSRAQTCRAGLWSRGDRGKKAAEGCTACPVLARAVRRPNLCCPPARTHDALARPRGTLAGPGPGTGPEPARSCSSRLRVLGAGRASGIPSGSQDAMADPSCPRTGAPGLPLWHRETIPLGSSAQPLPVG